MTLRSLPPWVPYTIPFGLFLLLTTFEIHLPPGFYPWFYTLKIVLVGAAVIGLRGAFPEARPGGSGWAVATALGVILCFVWITIEKHTPHFAFLGTRTAYNPAVEINSSVGVATFLGVRFLGLTVVTPIIEELFYRSLLLRFVTDPDDFQRVPQGTFSVPALLISTAVFAVSHPEWLAAAIFALALCLLLRGTKNLFACILAHGVTNLLLGIYVVHTGHWELW